MTTRIALDDRTEWLEADGLGGFASGTSSGIRTRRYHALLLVATTPPTGRMVLVNGIDAWIERPGAPDEYLTRQRYAPGVVAPEHGAELDSFTAELRLEPFPEPFHGVFIRAPKIAEPAGEEAGRVRVLGRHQGSPVLVESGNCLLATFHPELTDDLRLHRYFVERIVNRRPEER